MNITRIAAVAVLVAIRFKTADKWDLDRVQKKLSGINETAVADDLKGIEDKAVLADLKAVLAANEKSEALTVEDDSKPAEKAEKSAGKDPGKTAEDKVAESAGVKTMKSAKATKHPTTPPKSDVVRDKFGNREGSQAAAINAQLKKSWTDEETIAKGAKVTVARVRGHVKWLIGQKKAESGEKGYRLV